MRLGWFRPVHCKSLPAQEVRALLTARKLIQGKLHDIEMSIRGILRGFGLKVGPTTRRTYAARIRELIEGHPTLEAIAASLLKVRDALADEFAGFERKLRALTRQDDNAVRLMTTPGVGVLVALTFVSAVDAPERRYARIGPLVGERLRSQEQSFVRRLRMKGTVRFKRQR
jgi:transposase